MSTFCAFRKFCKREDSMKRTPVRRLYTYLSYVSSALGMLPELESVFSRIMMNFISNICTPAHSCNYLISKSRSSSAMTLNQADEGLQLWVMLLAEWRTMCFDCWFQADRFEHFYNCCSSCTAVSRLLYNKEKYPLSESSMKENGLLMRAVNTRW